MVLHYPTAYYFYVHKDNQALADDIAAGLERAIADGSFDALFDRYYGEVVRHANLSNRRVFDLVNPLLPEDVPLHRKDYWLGMAAN